MNYINTEIGLKLIVDDNLLKDFVRVGRKYYPNEFGGLLVGYYENDFKTFNITDTLLPTVFKSKRYLFERDTEGLENKLKTMFQEIPSKYYVGEWHTHPDGSINPSSTDRKAINSIINHAEVLINNPVFLIISLTKHEQEFGFYVSFKNKLYKYEQQN